MGVHRKTVAEAFGVVNFVCAPAPGTIVQNAVESMDFHAIKVMQKKVAPETAWVKELKQVLLAFKDWCNDNCKMGITWSASGEDASAHFQKCPVGSAVPQGGKGGGKSKAPPPPLKHHDTSAAPKPVGGGMGDVFAAINKGTGGLKKVTDDMKTKNRPKDDVAPSVAPKKTAATAAAGGKRGKGPRGPPVKELQKDTNWVIENFENESDLQVDEELSLSNLVCIINCKNCAVRVPTKVKSIAIDGCEKVNLICADVLSSVELVNSDRMLVQTTGKCNSFAIDKCDGVKLWLSQDSAAADITTAKSSEMNVVVPDPNDPSDTIEIPIPEQFVSRVLPGAKKLVTEVSGIYA